MNLYSSGRAADLLKETPRKFTMQQCFEIGLHRPSTMEPVAYLTSCKTSGLEKSGELVYATGSRGNVYIGRAFSHTIRATLNVTLADWNMEVLAEQNGSIIQRGKTQPMHHDVSMVVPATGETMTTQYKAVGAVGSEIGFLYKMNNDGTANSTKKLRQGTAAEKGVFAYANGTITLHTDDATELAGSKMIADYRRNTTETAQKIIVTSDGMPPLVRVFANGLAADECDGALYPMQIEGTAQIQPGYTFDLSADGDAAIQNLTMEFVKSCMDNTLYTMTVFTEEDGV